MPFVLENVVRPNILALKPYRCARNDYSEGILLDANENAYGPSLPSGDSANLNRYPDPAQHLVKTAVVALRGLRGVENLFLGVGSDEVIDLLIRIFCVPARDKVLITPPTYAMYSVSAQINDVEVVKVNLDVEDGKFQIKPGEINARLASDPNIKLVFLCSPGNPTGTVLSHASIRAVLESPSYTGIVVIDEAYIDFVSEDRDGSVATWVEQYPNLVVMQTLSKSFGLAGIRLGIAISHPSIIQLMNNIKAPYNISTPTSQIALRALSPLGHATMRAHLASILSERARLIAALKSFPVSGVWRIIGGNDANFVLIQIVDVSMGRPDNAKAERVYKRLAESEGVVMRFRGDEIGCEACLRVTVGREEDNNLLLERLEKVLSEKCDREVGARIFSHVPCQCHAKGVEGSSRLSDPSLVALLSAVPYLDLLCVEMVSLLKNRFVPQPYCPQNR
ncbi:histidinol-phosphate aminotransferase [Jimgerdemannia flammicorona]|uniref:histidinol-phosphate transaminase n=1 Tax=Jimgerdemannia flammicorona TaxID=994334 RepID=A0A433A2Z3_9FUNG|nr:histidinol-phosphate aminotransferase [Jimgerdemannia flammicorona]